MAVTYANRQIIYRGPVTLIYAEITLDNSYAAGGETINASDFGLSTVIGVVPILTGGYDVSYKKTNDTSGALQVFASLTPDTNSATSVPLEASVGRDLSTVTVTCIVVGR